MLWRIQVTQTMVVVLETLPMMGMQTLVVLFARVGATPTTIQTAAALEIMQMATRKAVCVCVHP